MKAFLSKCGWLLPVLLLCGLIVFPAQVSSAASGAALLWWTRVLPALLPYLIAASLLDRSGILLRVPKRLLPPALFLFGALGGYPVGAKLARSLQERRILPQRDCAQIAICCDLPNPVFLLSVVSLGFFGEPACAIPLLIGVYGASLPFAYPLLRLRPSDVPSLPRTLCTNDLPDAIGDGVRTVGVIGGCLVFASVLGALTESTGLFRALHRLTGLAEASISVAFLGLFEMTCGIGRASALPLSLSLRLAFAAFFAQFGGVSVALQVRSLFPVSGSRYVLRKLACAACSAALTGLLASAFLKDTIAPTFASAAQMQQNACAMLSVSAAAALGLLFVFVFTARFTGRKKRPCSEEHRRVCRN